jgi:hypothetical protein
MMIVFDIDQELFLDDLEIVKMMICELNKEMDNISVLEMSYQLSKGNITQQHYDFELENWNIMWAELFELDHLRYSMEAQFRVYRLIEVEKRFFKENFSKKFIDRDYFSKTLRRGCEC